ncbi:unnamed protein product [Closterium sp. NIES-53]
MLDNSWDNLIPTLNTQQDQWTPEWLRQQILQEDFRTRHTGGGAANKTAKGYGAAGGSKGRGGGRGRGRGRGFGRGRGRGDYNEGHGSSGGRGSTRMEGACWYCKKAGHPWFKCFSRREGWAPPGVKPPSGERARGGAVQGSGAQGDGAHGKADPRMLHNHLHAKLGKLLLWDLEEKSSCIKDLWQLPIIPWNGKPPATAAYGATAKATTGGEETAPTDGALDADKKVQQSKQPHGEVLAGVDATAAWAKASSRSGEADWEMWHERLCHVNFPMLQNSGTWPAKAPLALVHMDVVGPTRAPSLSGSRFFLTIVDDHTRAVWVYPLKTKGEVAAAVLKEWMPRAQRESGHKVKVIRTGNGGEFIGADFEAVLKKKGIQHQLTEGARSLLGRAGLPDPFWVIALRQVALVKNRVLATVGDKQWVPCTKWYGSAPAVNMLRAYGCMVVFHVPKENRGKLEASGRWGVHLGLAKDHKGWLIWDLSSQQVQVTVSDEEISGVTEDGGEPEVVRAGSVAEQCDEDEIAQCYWAAVPEPKMLAEALSGPDAEKWKQSVKEEYASLFENETWELCELPPGKKAISSKLIFRHKYGPDGELIRYKSMLVAKGFQQTKGKDFDEIFAPVGKGTTLRSAAMIERVEEMLEMQFKCSKMGDVKYYLGMHVERDLDKGVLRLHQRKYCEGLAEKYGLQDGGKLATPLPSGFTVETCADEEVVGESDRKLFHSMVGALNYAVNHTQPDIAFATSRLASVVSRPSHEQLEAAKRLVRYVSATASMGLEYSAVRQRQQRGAADLGKGEMLLTCYTDAIFNSAKADGTSIGGYVCLFGGGAISWRSKKQNDVGLSSCETEYMALHHGAKEVVWLRRLLEEIGVCQNEPTMIFCYNESAVKLAKNASSLSSTLDSGASHCFFHDRTSLTLLPTPGIRQSWTLPESPQQNGVAERHIGSVMEIARTSMTHARAPHFLWPYAVWYTAHQLNLWPRVSRPEVSPTSLWIGSPGAASRFRVWGCLALVRNTSADKISPHAVPCVFLGFPKDSSDYTLYHPPLHRFIYSCDVRFDESVPYYVRYLCRALTVPPPPLFLTSAPPPAPLVQPPPPPPGPAPSGVSHATPPPSLAPQVQPPQSSSQPTADPAGAGFRGEDLGGASSRGGAEPVNAGDSSLRGACFSGAVPEGATTGGAPSAGPGESGMGLVTSGGAGSGGGATAIGERFGAAAAGATAAGAAAAAAAAAPAAAAAGAAIAAAAGAATAATSSSTVFPPPLPPLSPPLSHTWPSCRSPHARLSSPVPFTDLRTALFHSSPPRSSPSVLPSPPESALTASLSTPVTDYYLTYCAVLSHVISSLVIDPRASLSSVSALTAAVTEFASTRRLDYATSLMAAPPTCPVAVGGESAIGYDALEDRHFELEFLAAASPHLCAMLLAPEGDPNALDIATPRTYAEAVSWVKRPPGSPPVFKWRLRRPVYGLRQDPREWHDTLRSTLSGLGFQPSIVGPSLFVRRGSTPYFVLVYVNDLVFATADKVALADVKLELQKRHTCTELGELCHYLDLQITRDRAARTITLSLSHMVKHVLQRFELQHSTVQRTHLAVDHRLTGSFPDERIEPSGPYVKLVGCLMYPMTCSRPDLAFPLSILARFVAPGRHRPVHWIAAVRVAKYTHSSSVSTSTTKAEIYAGAMAAQELRCLTFLLTDLGERPSSAPTLFTDNKATILLC